MCKGNSMLTWAVRWAEQPIVIPMIGGRMRLDNKRWVTMRELMETHFFAIWGNCYAEIFTLIIPNSWLFSSSAVTTQFTFFPLQWLSDIFSLIIAGEQKLANNSSTIRWTYIYHIWWSGGGAKQTSHLFAAKMETNIRNWTDVCLWIFFTLMFMPGCNLPICSRVSFRIWSAAGKSEPPTSQVISSARRSPSWPASPDHTLQSTSPSSPALPASQHQKLQGASTLLVHSGHAADRGQAVAAPTFVSLKPSGHFSAIARKPSINLIFCHNGARRPEVHFVARLKHIVCSL